MAKKKPIKKNETGTVFIRATEHELKLFEKLRGLTGEKTNTKAILKACERCLEQSKDISLLEERIDKLQKELGTSKEVLQMFFHGMQNVTNYGKKHFPEGKYPQGKLF